MASKDISGDGALPPAARSPRTVASFAVRAVGRDIRPRGRANGGTGMKDTATITGWHAHVYFGPEQQDRARGICEGLRDRFGVTMGRMHPQPVGPHPTGSCQMTVPPDRFADVIGWLALNRDGLTVFAHAETDDAMADHLDHVVWLGESVPLRLDVLRAALNKT
jgi:DOPA 4,5-dioxygenase